MRFLTRADREEPAVKARLSRRFRRRASYAGAAAAIMVSLTAGGWYAVSSGAVASALTPLQMRVALAARRLGLTVQSVEVVGRDRTAKKTILRALEVRRGTPIFAVDLAAAKARLQDLPWIRSAAVERLRGSIDATAAEKPWDAPAPPTEMIVLSPGCLVFRICIWWKDPRSAPTAQESPG